MRCSRVSRSIPRDLTVGDMAAPSGYGPHVDRTRTANHCQRQGGLGSGGKGADKRTRHIPPNESRPLVRPPSPPLFRPLSGAAEGISHESASDVELKGASDAEV